MSLRSHSSDLCPRWFGFETYICVDEVVVGKEVRDGQDLTQIRPCRFTPWPSPPVPNYRDYLTGVLRPCRWIHLRIIRHLDLTTYRLQLRLANSRQLFDQAPPPPARAPMILSPIAIFAPAFLALMNATQPANKQSRCISSARTSTLNFISFKSA